MRKYCKRNVMVLPVYCLAYSDQMNFRSLLGHLLITFAFQANLQKGESRLCCAVTGDLRYSCKTRPVISRSSFFGWGRNTRVVCSQTYVSQLKYYMAVGLNWRYIRSIRYNRLYNLPWVIHSSDSSKRVVL